MPDPFTARLRFLASELEERFSERVFDELNAEYEVHPFRRRSLIHWQVEEGLALWTNGLADEPTTYREPVRSRRMLSSEWHSTQTAEDAAGRISETIEKLAGPSA
jgi:hypothetical protein